MNSVWHIARKDLFRLRFILGLWVIVITGHVMFATLQSNLDPAASILMYVPALVFGFIFLPAFSLGLTMGVLRDDPLADSDAFWVTRPISGAQLLGAKILVFAILALVPAALNLPWWAACDYGRGQIVQATLHTVRWNGSLMAFTVAFAAVSASIGRFVMSVLSAAAVFLLLALAQSRFALGSADGTALGFEPWSRFMAAAWWFASALIVLNQFLSRRTARSMAIAAFVMAVAFGGSLLLTAGKPASADSGAVVQPPRLEAVLNPTVGAVSHREGLRARVVEAAPDFTRGYVIVVTEITPDFTYPEWMQAPASPPAAARHGSYFLVHRGDRRSLPARSATRENVLVVATLRHTRHELVFSAPPAWQRDPAFNFNTWISGAVLVKVSAAADLAAPPAELLPADFSSP